jgi:hypothetical protein
MNDLPFTGQDILDALMRAAFKPEVTFSHMAMDGSGQPSPQYDVTPALIEPLVRLVGKFIESDEAFQDALKAAVLARLPEIAEGLVAKVTGTNSAFGISMVRSGFGQHEKYEIAEWLRTPLGEAMAEALKPALVEHFNGEDGRPNFSDASVEINVTVKP